MPIACKAAVALGCVSWGLSSVAAVAQERLTPELLWKLRRVGAPAVSPSGEHVLYSVRTYDLEANSGQSHLYLRTALGGAAVQLTRSGSNFDAHWLSDGSIVFLSTRSGDVQAHVLELGGGEARQVTHHAGGIANLRPSPDGKWLAFTAEVRTQPTLLDQFPDLPAAEARIYDDLMVRHWDQWNDGTSSHLFVVSIDGGEATDLMAGEAVDTPLKPFGGGEQIAWAPDSERLCYTAKRVPEPQVSTNSDLYMVPRAGGEHVNLTGDNPGYDTEPVFSPDGRWLAYHSMPRAGFESDRNRLMLLDLENGESRHVHEGTEVSVHGTQWARDGSGLYFTVDTQGTTQVMHSTLDGVVRPVTRGRWQFGGVAVGSDRLFALRSQTERPFEIVTLPSEGEPTEGTALTDENGPIYATLKLPQVQERRFEATDGKEIHSWVVYPPDFDPAKKWPMLLYCQGGPQSQVGQWFSFRWNFHLMAAQGYIVLAVNRRGLPGFGQEWNDSISRDWGGQCMQDLLSACDAMQEEPYVDASKTGAVGASFGGYTIYWLMGHGGDRFASMISHCGVFNLRSMYLSTEELFFVNWDLGGPYWESPEIAADYDRFSPNMAVQNWKTPLLVVHGQRDYRVPFEQGLQAFQAAQIQGVPSRLLYFPDEGHWVLSPQNGVLWHRVFFDWLDRYCK